EVRRHGGLARGAGARVLGLRPSPPGVRRGGATDARAGADPGVPLRRVRREHRLHLGPGASPARALGAAYTPGMCGGYELEADPEALVEAFRIDHNQLPEPPRGEFFPRMQAPIVVARVAQDGRVERWLGPARWGLVPFWAEDLSF